MEHDFKKYPELTNNQIEKLYWESPHKQITEDFEANVVKVTDGDTIWVTCNFRDFKFKIRLADINAPEMNEGGEEAKEWLKEQIEGENVIVKIDPDNRVGKWGRLLGTIVCDGIIINEALVNQGWATDFNDLNAGEIPELSKWL